MKKSLDASKKKLAEKQKENGSLQKALKESRKEQAALERRVQGMTRKEKERRCRWGRRKRKDCLAGRAV